MVWQPDAVERRVRNRVFPDRVVENRWRGEIVEEFVAGAVKADGWELWSHDWSSWDLHHRHRRLKLQVKQSAAQQTWAISQEAKSTFRIAPNKGYYDGNTWIALPSPARIAEVYVFAKNVTTGEETNHWDIRQWSFKVLGASFLPSRKSLNVRDAWSIDGGAEVRIVAGRSADAVAEELRRAVQQVTERLDSNGIWPPSWD